MPENHEERPQSRQVPIEIDNAIADGVYANLAFIATNTAEFILDFARFLPGNTRGKIVSRIVINPIHAKALARTLNEAVSQYEKKFGPISSEPNNKNIGFQIDKLDAGESGQKQS
jgi:hypothetical protein